MKVVIIGSGNTASVLGHRIKDAGHEIIQVYSRKLPNAEELADELDCSATDSFSAIDKNAQLYIVALTDTALASLHQHWQQPNGLVVHTAGSVNKDVLQQVAKNYGVLYPLQSLRKEKRDYDTIPLLVDAASADDLLLITGFAETLSPVVRHASDDYRLKMHVAAVMVNNFTNYLYMLAADFCKKENVHFDLLKPLIEETATRIGMYEPASVQTGPAVRGDEKTLALHMEMLADHPILKQFYELFTASIRKK